MKQTFKRTLSALLAVVMLLTLSPVPLASAEGTGDEVITILNQDTALPVQTAYRQYDVPADASFSENGYFRVEYTVDDSGGTTDPEPVILVLTGSGDGQGWTNVQPSSTGTTTDGKYADYSYESCIAGDKWSDLSTLTKIGVQLWNITGKKPITVTQIAYYPSEASGASLDDGSLSDENDVDTESLGEDSLNASASDVNVTPVTTPADVEAVAVEPKTDKPAEGEDALSESEENVVQRKMSTRTKLRALAVQYAGTPTVTFSLGDDPQTIPYAKDKFISCNAESDLKNAIKEGGYFRIEYTPLNEDAKTGTMVLLLQGTGGSNSWVNVKPSTDHTGTVSGERLYAEYTYEDVVAGNVNNNGFGSNFSSELSKVGAQFWNNEQATIHSITYVNPASTGGGDTEATLTAERAFLGQAVTVTGGSSWAWYRSEWNTTEGGTAISGATSAAYTPTTEDLGRYLYCVSGDKTLGPIPVFAANKQVDIELFSGEKEFYYTDANNKSVSGSLTTVSAAEFDLHALAPGGKFVMTYTHEEGADCYPALAPTYSGMWVEINNTPTSTGTVEFTYEQIKSAYDTKSGDMSKIANLQAKMYPNNTVGKIKVTSLKWVGYPIKEIQENVGTLNATKAILNTPISVTGGNVTSPSYQWYRSEWNTVEGSTAINGATSASYTPTEDDLRHYLYCKVNTTIVGPVPVFAEDTEVTRVLYDESFNIGPSDTAYKNVLTLANAASVGFDRHMITPGGKFVVTYTATTGKPRLYVQGSSASIQGQQYRLLAEGTDGTSSTLEFSYKQFFGTDAAHFPVDLSLLQYVGIQRYGSNDSFTVTKVEWVDTAVDKPLEKPDSGNLSSTQAFLRQAISVENTYQSSYTYQWYRLAHYGLTGGEAISGATANAYTPTGLDLGS